MFVDFLNGPLEEGQLTFVNFFNAPLREGQLTFVNFFNAPLREGWLMFVVFLNGPLREVEFGYSFTNTPLGNGRGWGIDESGYIWIGVFEQ